VINSQYQDAVGARASPSRSTTSTWTEKLSKELAVDVPADGAKNSLTPPIIKDLTGTYFISLTLNDSKGAQVGSNFYWLSAKQETSTTTARSGSRPPTKQFADMHGAQSAARRRPSR
jgi:hypothetical protein